MTDAHRHDPETGEVILEEAETPGETEARAVVEAAKVEAEAEVEQTRIMAETQVELAKIDKADEATEEQNELEALRIEVASLREQLAPPPAPEPVVIEAPEPPSEPEPENAPPEAEGTEPPKEHHRRSGLGMW